MVEVYNVTEDEVELESEVLRGLLGQDPWEAIAGYEWSLSPERITVEPYGVLWFVS